MFCLLLEPCQAGFWNATAALGPSWIQLHGKESQNFLRAKTPDFKGLLRSYTKPNSDWLWKQM